MQQTDAVLVVQRLRQAGHRVRVLFMDAANTELVRRYVQTRRKHPLAQGEMSVEEAIVTERRILESVKGASDVVIDTTGINPHQLKNRIVELFSLGDSETMQISVVSFGYKHGIPIDVDLVFDVRFIPNPHWDENLRPLSGLDESVRSFVLGQKLTKDFLDRLLSMLEMLIPAYRDEGKSYLSIAIGCTGGRHRSVAVAEQLAERLHELGHRPRTTHRDLQR